MVETISNLAQNTFLLVVTLFDDDKELLFGEWMT